MDVTSKILRIVGIIANVVLILLGLIFVLLFGTAVANPDIVNQVATDMGQQPDFIRNYLNLIFIVGLVGLIAQVLVFVAVFVFNRVPKTPVGKNIALIVLGVVGFNVFYLFAAIFGFIAAKDAQEQLEE